MPIFNRHPQLWLVASCRQDQDFTPVEKKNPTCHCRWCWSQDWPTSACAGLVWEFSDYSLSRNRTEVDLPPTSPSSALPSMTAVLCMCASAFMYSVSVHIALSYELCGEGLMRTNWHSSPGVVNTDWNMCERKFVFFHPHMLQLLCFFTLG